MALRRARRTPAGCGSNVSTQPRHAERARLCDDAREHRRVSRVHTVEVSHRQRMPLAARGQGSVRNDHRRAQKARF
jgi:hypothetical protein